MTREILRTERLILRPARWEDLPAMHQVLSDPVAMRYWAFAAHTTMDETELWLRSMIEAPADQSHDFVVEHEGELIGKTGCWRLPEIGFILRRDHWGQGFAQEAMNAVIPSVFARFPELPRLMADVDPRNQASLRLLKRLGFKTVSRAKRTWFVNDEWCDSVYLALDREKHGRQ
jgi:RimJ/RimL family protein N-acetyltransferase